MKKDEGEVSPNLLIAAYAMAILFPLIGGILAIYILIKGHWLHFIGVMIVTLCFWVEWTILLTPLFS